MINKLDGREEIEWSNFWYDRANTTSEHRLLLLGDSTSRQIRSTMSRILDIPVDMFGSSAALRDVLFWNQLECFFCNSLYHYDAIVVWIGNHSRINKTGMGPFETEDYYEFEEDFSKLLSFVKKYSSKILVLNSFDLVIPHKPKTRRIEKIIRKIKPHYTCEEDKKENEIVMRKNELIEVTCSKTNTDFLDICGIMKGTSYNRTDHIHYESASNQFVCNTIIKALSLSWL